MSEHEKRIEKLEETLSFHKDTLDILASNVNSLSDTKLDTKIAELVLNDAYSDSIVTLWDAQYISYLIVYPKFTVTASKVVHVQSSNIVYNLDKEDVVSGSAWVKNVNVESIKRLTVEDYEQLINSIENTEKVREAKHEHVKEEIKDLKFSLEMLLDGHPYFDYNPVQLPADEDEEEVRPFATTAEALGEEEHEAKADGYDPSLSDEEAESIWQEVKDRINSATSRANPSPEMLLGLIELKSSLVTAEAKLRDVKQELLEYFRGEDNS